MTTATKLRAISGGGLTPTRRGTRDAKATALHPLRQVLAAHHMRCVMLMASL